MHAQYISFVVSACIKKLSIWASTGPFLRSCPLKRFWHGEGSVNSRLSCQVQFATPS